MDMLNTVDYGWVRVVDERPSAMFDTLLGVDLGAEYEYWYTTDNEVVAFPIDDRNGETGLS